MRVRPPRERQIHRTVVSANEPSIGVIRRVPNNQHLKLLYINSLSLGVGDLGVGNRNQFVFDFVCSKLFVFSKKIQSKDKYNVLLQIKKEKQNAVSMMHGENKSRRVMNGYL